MVATTVDRKVRDRVLCERHLGMARVFGAECQGAGCKERPVYAFRVPVDGSEDRVRRLCTAHSARRVRRLMTLPRPSKRLRLACRLAGLTVRQFGDLPGSATARWFRAADAHLAGGA